MIVCRALRTRLTSTNGSDSLLNLGGERHLKSLGELTPHSYGKTTQRYVPFALVVQGFVGLTRSMAGSRW